MMEKNFRSKTLTKVLFGYWLVIAYQLAMSQTFRSPTFPCKLDRFYQVSNAQDQVDPKTHSTKIPRFRLTLAFLIKLKKQNVHYKAIPNATSLCEICENSVYFRKGLDYWLSKTSQLPINRYDIVETFSCNSASEECTQLTFTCSKSWIEALEKAWNMFKVNNTNTRTTSLTSFRCFYC